MIANTNYKKLVKEAIVRIDVGFNGMNRVVKNPSMIDRYLIASTYKSIRLNEGIMTLCDRGLADESMPILRSLIENVINMRWIMNSNTKERFKLYLGDLGNGEFGEFWSPANLLERMKEVGFDSSYYYYCVKVTYSYSHVNASSLDWGKVINDARLNNMSFSSEAIYAVVAQMLGHLMKALNNRFQDHFKEYDSILKKIKVDPDIRKKVKAIMKRIK